MAETVRVFISSPGDVAEERALARQVLNRLRKKERYKGRIQIEEVSWDDPDNPFTFDAHYSFQKAIDLGLSQPSQCDVVVVILWSRLGSPLSDQFRRPDGRICRSGTEWEYLDALSNPGTKIWLFHRTEPIPYLGDDQDFDAKRAQELAVKAFLKELNDATGANRHGNNGYASPSLFERRFENTLADWLDKRLFSIPVMATADTTTGIQLGEESKDSQKESDKPIREGNPYRGLQSFGSDDAPIFFGRGLETDALVTRVRDGSRVLAVVGASGSGKSSLVAAGLLPRLKMGAVPGSQHWVTARFTPAERGYNPFRALALALPSLLPSGRPSVDDMATRLTSEPGYIETLAGELLTGKPADSELLLFVDQFEELFTARVDKEHRAPFVALMEAIAKANRVRLVLSLRADYYAHCTEYPGLAALLREGSFPLAAPDDRALTEMVEGPARVAGLEVEPGLVVAIARDAGDGPGRLALVEYALENLYNLRRGNTLSVAAYHDELKGIAGLIQRQGDQAAQDASQEVRHKLFDALSEVDTRGGAVRKRAFLDELSEPARGLAKHLGKARLLTADRDPETNRAWVEVAHEAVLRDWPLFSEWLRDYSAFKLWRQGLEMARDRWAGSGQKTDDLLSGGALKEAVLKQRERPEELTAEQTTFITRSRWRNRILKAKVAALVLLAGLVVSSLFSLLIILFSNPWVQRLETRPVIPEMVEIPAGSFCMGSRLPDTPAPAECPDLPEDDEADPDETPARRVSVSAFRLGKYEVTAGEYRRFVKARQAEGNEINWDRDASSVDSLPPSDLAHKDRLPAVNLSYDEAVGYAEWLWEETGRKGPKYRLPSEAEWEYAARGPDAVKTVPLRRRWWSVGPKDVEKKACAHANVLDRKALLALKASGIYINSESFACETDGYVRSAPIGRFDSNRFGLYDMLGNVWEWVHDCYHETYQGRPSEGMAWMDGRDCQSDRQVVRGGSWDNGPKALRSADRLQYIRGDRDDAVGFRLAQDLK
jgi:formylglycine-generating enzyme required for sulfatase activity